VRYLGIMFILLFAFAVFVTFTVIAGGDIENILSIAGDEDDEGLLIKETETKTKTNDIQVFKNYIVKENELIDFDYYEFSEYYDPDDSDEEKQIMISVFDIKTNEVMTVGLEEYLCGVVFSEMPSSFETEALKAQAVAARSYCIYKMLYSTDKNREEHHGADICNDYRHCKDHISYEESCEKYGEEYIKLLWEKVKNAVGSTKNEIIVYESEPAIAVFHAISGKGTESAENVWGNPVPYLVSVPSEEENSKSEIKNYITESIFDANEFKKLLTSNGFHADFSHAESSWVNNIKFNSSGRIDTVDICGRTITGRRIREIFSLRSTDFKLEYKNHAFVFTVTGYGHGVGMSQYGANLMAKDGKNYTEILLWYYTGVEISRAYKFFR